MRKRCVLQKSRPVRHSRWACLLLAGAISAVVGSAANAWEGLESSPRSPQDTLASIRVRDGYTIELVAAEPLVMDPVAIDWAPDGSLWVAEMADYPSGIDGKGKPGGRIRRLYDTDEDGRFDRAELFLTGVRFPTGILSWSKGVLVTAAPEIFYAEDTDGDGVADSRQVLFSGFLEGNQQLRVNGLRRGLDNWIYCASGSHHAGYGKENTILSHRTGERTAIGSRDFRFDPDSGAIDPESGPSQYGRNRDDWGNWFGVQNSHPLWHYVLSDADIRRNPLYAPPDPRVQLVTPTNPRVYPIKATQKRFHSFHHANRFTSACSGMIYRDSLLFSPGDQRQHSFTCEPFHNVVQHNILLDDGVSFVAQRDPAEAEFDFFASGDRWCRPVMARTGPDGALWVVDIYRYMIEHPHWLPEEGQDELRPHFRAGEDRGRIYRIYPDERPPRQLPRFDRFSIEELVEALQDSNGWRRDYAQYRLVSLTTESDRKRAVRLLRELFKTTSSARGRLHALCALEGLEALDSNAVSAGLTDPHPAIRRRALQLAPEVDVDFATMEPLVDDPNAKVRLQMAVTLGDLRHPSAPAALAKLVVRDADDPLIVAAGMTSLREDHLAPLVHAISPRFEELPLPFLRTAFGQIALLADAEILQQARITLSKSESKQRQFAALAALLDSGERGTEPASALANELIQPILVTARATAVDPAAPLPARLEAVQLLFRRPGSDGHDPVTVDWEAAERLLAPQSPPELQRAVVERVASLSDVRLAILLLADWRSHSPALRGRVLNVLTSRSSWSDVLVDHLEKGSIPVAEIDATTRRRLTRTSNTGLRSRAEMLFAAVQQPDRQRALDSYRRSLELDGQAERGAAVFAKHCATCHRVGEVGHEVGPNLAALPDRSPRTLLASILDPSAAVEGKYLEYVVVGTDGRTWTGILASETGSSVTLLGADGKRESILRDEIEAMQSTGKSLMPDGMEKDVPVEAMADLLAFLAG